MILPKITFLRLGHIKSGHIFSWLSGQKSPICIWYCQGSYYHMNFIYPIELRNQVMIIQCPTILPPLPLAREFCKIFSLFAAHGEVVMGTGNPWANFRAPAPLPVKTRTHNQGYGFPTTMGKGTLRPKGSTYPHGFL